MPVGGPNPREANNYGQIVRWFDNGDHGALNFAGPVCRCGNLVVHTDARVGSANMTPDNMFNAPDGLAFDLLGML